MPENANTEGIEEPRRFPIKYDRGTYEPIWVKVDLLLWPDGHVTWTDHNDKEVD